jgi:hypothetical protein
LLERWRQSSKPPPLSPLVQGRGRGEPKLSLGENFVGGKWGRTVELFCGSVSIIPRSE